jgi:hypothetical protein
MLANARAKDPVRQEAYRLSKLESVYAWRGKIVDTVISEAIIPSIARGQPYSFKEALLHARRLFDQRKEAISSNSEMLQKPGATPPRTAFFESEYGIPLTSEVFDQAIADIEQAITNFYKADSVWSLLDQARYLIPQRPVTFTRDDFTVQVVPDLIMFRIHQPPVIFDWKVNTWPIRDYWLQLVTGAIALARCKPHRDWPNDIAQYKPYETELFEVQLLSADVRKHIVSPNDIDEAEDFILASATEMIFACDNKPAKQLIPDDFAVTENPKTCIVCAFRKLCWG